MAGKREVLEVGGRQVTISNPDKVFFSRRGQTKLDLVRYYLELAPQVLAGVAGRPLVLKRYPDGAGGESFYQKRAPSSRPPWVETAEVRYPSGRRANLLVCRTAADLAWVVNLGCIDLNPWPVRAEDTDHPDELRIDLDPQPGTAFETVRRVALVVRELLDEYGLAGFPKLSGSRGMHVHCPIRPAWGFEQARRSALALAREAERRAPGLATSAWWKEERRGVFIDYNQNARDRTLASVWSVRPTPDARVAAALRWDDVEDVNPAELRMDTAPRWLAERGDPWAAYGERVGGLEPLLELVERHEREGLGDAPWPPHFPRGAEEPKRVAPSRARKGGAGARQAPPRPRRGPAE